MRREHLLLVQLDARPHACRIELDGRDITTCVTGIELGAHVGSARTKITLHLLANVTVIGTPGSLEIVKHHAHPAPRITDGSAQ